jgi:hypothetical protein
MAAANPFAAAFDAYWKWPILGQLHTAETAFLPQLNDLPCVFPDARHIQIIDNGTQVKFEAPGLGPLGSTVYVCLTSPSMESLATGFKWCMHIYPTIAPRPVCCGLFTTTQGNGVDLVVRVDDVKNQKAIVGGTLTLDHFKALDINKKGK